MKYLALILLAGCVSAGELSSDDDDADSTDDDDGTEDDDDSVGTDDDDDSALDLVYACLTVAFSPDGVELDSSSVYVDLVGADVVISSCDHGWIDHLSDGATSFHWNQPEVTITGAPPALAADLETEWEAGFMIVELVRVDGVDPPQVSVAQIGGGHHLMTISAPVNEDLSLDFDPSGDPALSSFTTAATPVLSYLPDLADPSTVSDRIFDETGLVTLTL